MSNFSLDRSLTKARKTEFANWMIDIQKGIDFKVSSRGWCYLLEGAGLITKDQFDKGERAINNCRREGYLPIDFVAEDIARTFSGVEIPDNRSVIHLLQDYLYTALHTPEQFTPDWWEGEEYYIQCLTEKVDMVSMLHPLLGEYHIPIANAKGWSSMLQRARFTKRFQEAEDEGLSCVLLYFGDYDPSGLQISDNMDKNLEDLIDIHWNDGIKGYDPANLIVERIGLNYDFIEDNSIPWIDNLITGAKTGCNDLGDPKHKDHFKQYVQEYIAKLGKRKCECNVCILPEYRQITKDLFTSVIESYLGDDVLDRFQEKTDAIQDEFDEFLSDTGLDNTIESALKLISDI